MKLERPLKNYISLPDLVNAIESLYEIKITKSLDYSRKSKNKIADARKVYFASAVMLTIEPYHEILSFIGVKDQAKTYYSKCVDNPSVGLRLMLNDAYDKLGIDKKLSFEKEIKEGQEAIKQVEYLTELIRHIDEEAGIEFVPRYDEVRWVL